MTHDRADGYARFVMRGLHYANAFVVQFRGAKEADVESFSGRVEHVASGRNAAFQTVDELPQILLKMLKTVASEKRKRIE